MPTLPAATEAPPRLIASLRSLVATWVAVLQTRVELFATDLEDQYLCISKIVFLGVASIFCLSFGVLLLTLFVVVWFWDTHRLEVLGGFTLLYLGAGLTAAVALRNRVKSRPKFLGTTRDELSKDYKHLTS
jgi:uncharacterized membrane protein YqjE